MMESGGDAAIDLSLRHSPGSHVPILRPIPRPPWSILWYQNLWSLTSSTTRQEQSDVNSNTTCSLNNSNNSEASSFSLFNCLTSSRNNSTATTTVSYNFPFVDNHHRQSHCQNGLARLSSMSADRCHIANTATTTPTLISRKANKDAINSKGYHGIMRKECDISNDGTFSDHHHYDTMMCSSDDEDDEAHNQNDDGNDSENSAHIVVTSSTNSDTSFNNNNNNDSNNSNKSFSVSDENDHLREHRNHHPHSTVLDIACCDGPVQFKRISNPNFALTVEHNETCPTDANSEKCSTTSACTTTCAAGSRTSDMAATHSRKSQHHHNHTNNHTKSGGSGGGNGGVTSLKTYLCIYCNQSFKSLFCYQKHKKRHLNPVSVDITTTSTSNFNSTSQRGLGNGSSSSSGGGGGGGVTGVVVGISPENNTKAKTKDLNVQFFPCKKCGCKFPSYYFVHKHRKICH